jgi:hypothetical protein
MSPEDWKIVKKHLEEALRRSPDDRASFLDEVCGADGRLRAEVESLLEAERRLGDFMEEPIFDLHEDPREEGSG